MKSSKILREAARLIHAEDEEFSCIAVDHASCYDRDLRCEYEGLMRPPLAPVSDPAWVSWAVEHGNLNGNKITEWRVMALLFFAAVKEAEGD